MKQIKLHGARITPIVKLNLKLRFKSQAHLIYSDAFFLAKGNITVVRAGVDDAAQTTDRNSKQAIFKNYARFTECITERNNTQVDNVNNLDAVMMIYNLIEYSNNYLDTFGSLWQ